MDSVDGNVSEEHTAYIFRVEIDTVYFSERLVSTVDITRRQNSEKTYLLACKKFTVLKQRTGCYEKLFRPTRRNWIKLRIESANPDEVTTQSTH